MQSFICVINFLILQFLWFCQRFFLRSQKKNVDELEDNPIKQLSTEEWSRRHMILLSTKNPNNVKGRPICQINVYQLLSPDDEELLRKACAKGSRKRSVRELSYLPEESMSKEHFTNLWLDSVSLAA